jgi:hypothetical protein
MLDVEVIVGKSSLGGLVLGKHFVELTHLRLEKLATELKLHNFLSVLDHTVVKTEFFRLKNSSLSLNLITVSSSLHLEGLLID